MTKTTRLEKVLVRQTRIQSAGHYELVDSFKRLQSLVERLSSYLSRQDLEGILSNISGRSPAADSSRSTLKQKPVSED